MVCLPQLGDYQIGFAENDKINNWVVEAWTSQPLTDHPRRDRVCYMHSSMAGWGCNKPNSSDSASLSLLCWDVLPSSIASIKTQNMQIQVEFSFWNWLQIERVNNNYYKKKTKRHFTRTRIYSNIGFKLCSVEPKFLIMFPHWQGRCKWIPFIRWGCGRVWVPVMLA